MAGTCAARGSEGLTMIVAVVADLIFESKIAGVARVQGVEVVCVRSADAALARLADARALLIDLTIDIEAMLALIRSAKAAFPAIAVVAFLPHVMTEQFAAASDAGADEALPRSAFHKRLPQLLSELDSGAA